MSTSRLQTTEGALGVFGGLLWIAIGVSAVSYFALGIDLLAIEGFGIPCVFHALTGFACPGCGMTRALVLASQGQWEHAVRMNPLVIALLGLALWSLRGIDPRRAQRASLRTAL